MSREVVHTAGPYPSFHGIKQPAVFLLPMDIIAGLLQAFFILNMIYHSTDYDKQGLDTYKSFEDYRLFDDGHVESLLTAQLNQEGVHVYVAKVQPFMKIKMNETKEHYDLWFILEGRGTNRSNVLQACKCNLL